jgi:hypothetical protein
MDEKFYIYMRVIGLTDSLIKRVEQIFAFYSEIIKIKIDDIFITDYIDKEGARHYENLWFFSKDVWMEAKNFVTTDNFDMAILKGPLKYWRVEKTDYDFLKVTEKSRLLIESSINEDIESSFKAARENCDFLKQVFLTRIFKI